ncbi:hypothetical protein JNB88_22340 [Rhizobium cauense]|uniref:hypothetical protein n=1 Tax=Rhizobium cauense TaxID=1166683 RepID=UPI001C6EB263|nr:hypothetical protein [Rhizobium cauense]MBW9116381.1 hypothetical protein [Rhizobium cauense]
MDETNPKFLSFRYADGTWTALVLTPDEVCEVQEMSAAKLIEIVEILETAKAAQVTDWRDFFR